MTQRGATLAGATLAAALAGSMLAGAAWAASDARSHWAAMSDCATLSDAAARHSCTDAVLRGAGLLDPAVSAAATAPVAAPRAVQEPTPAERDASAAATDTEAEDTEVTLAKAMRRGDGRLVLTASDGVIWRQLYRQGSMPIPRAGASMAVRKGALGGYVCAIARAPSFRCKPDS
jgi:hypothetical protein